MSTLAGQAIKDKYGNLLQVEGGVTSTLKTVEDGTGTTSALKVSSTNVEVDGTLSYGTVPSTDNTEATALLINGSNEVVKRELGTGAFTSNIAPLQEVVVGVTEADLTLTTTFQTVVFTEPNNTTENTSYHFGNTPAELRFTAADGTIESIAGEAFPVRVSITSAIEVTNPASIEYKIQRNTAGGSWSDIKTVIRDKGSSGANQADSFWGMFILGAEQGIRIQIRVSSGAATLKGGTELEVRKENVGNIL